MQDVQPARKSTLAILLQEEGLYHRCRIYATDMNETVLKSQGWYFPVGLMQDYTQHYLKAGGAFKYYTAAYDNAIFPSFLKKTSSFPNIT